MGFFGALGKIIQGKPVFEPGQKNNGAAQPQQPGGEFGGGTFGQSTAPQQPAQPQAPAATAGPKQMPNIEFERLVCTSNGTHMECDAHIKNHSQTDVDLDRFNFMGSSYDLGRVLRPGEMHEFRIFSGPRPNNTSYNRAELTVKDASGDYFQIIYHVEFDAVGDGTYDIDSIRPQMVKDI
jgi:hypothetical protein